MKAWDLIPKSKAAGRVLPGKWVFDTKFNEKGVITRYRAHWVICGNRQRPGIDYDEAYAPVATDEAVTLLFAKVVQEGLDMRQFDVVTAYLNAAMRGRTVCMRYPTGFGDDEHVCVILQALDDL